LRTTYNQSVLHVVNVRHFVVTSRRLRLPKLSSEEKRVDALEAYVAAPPEIR
jgi:hypothetical protein